MPLTIAVDGPASSGKGTVARGVARALGYTYVDTGAMYRAVALRCLQRDVDWRDADGASAVARSVAFDFRWTGESLEVWVDGEDISAAIRSERVGGGASDVATWPGVRDALLDHQRALGARGGVVMDGRDIGTVVLPDADLKIFLDATLEARAKRRHRELSAREGASDFARVRADLAQRDHRDRSRAIAPLRQAQDAVYVDTTDLSIPEAIAHIVDIAQRRTSELSDSR